MFLGPLRAYLLPIGREGNNGGFTLLTDRAMGRVVTTGLDAGAGRCAITGLGTCGCGALATGARAINGFGFGAEIGRAHV